MFKWIKNFLVKTSKKPQTIQLAKWKGKGKLKATDFETESDFTIEPYIGQPALLFFELEMFSKTRQEIRTKKLRDFEFVGEFKNGVRILIEKLILVSEGDVIGGVQMPLKLKIVSDISLNRKDFESNHDEKILFITCNLDFDGCEKTLTPLGGGYTDHFTINLEGYPIEIRQFENYKEIEKALKKRKILYAGTAQILVLARHNESERVIDIVEDLCKLMSYAKGNTINPYAEIYLKGKHVIREIRHTMRTEPFKAGDHVIPNLPFEIFPSFLEETYPNYVKYREELGMDVILTYYELMRRNPILDARCILGFVLLECLSNYAQKYFEERDKPVENTLKKAQLIKLSKILFNGKRIPENKIEELEKKRLLYSHPTLRDSIERLMEEFKMKYKNDKEKEIFSLRKEFIHKGKFPEGINPLETFNLLVHFIDRLILHMLGYKGEFLDISEGYKHKKLDYN